MSAEKIKSAELPLLGRRDILLAVVLTVICLILLAVTFLGRSEAQAVISVSGVEYERIDLKSSQDRVIKIDGKLPVSIEVKQGKIRFLSSGCPDKLCVNTGWLYKPGQVAVCLPAQVSVRLIGALKQIDIITE